MSRSRGRRERGAVAVFVAIVMTLVIPVTSAFVLDLGMQHVARSDMQSLADVVALDLSRELGTRTADQLAVVGQSLADASRDRNKSVIGYGGHVPTVTPTWGTVDTSGNFAQFTGTSVPTAVKVVASTSVAFGFGEFTHVDSGGATRSATAIATSGACFAIGSYAARLNTGASPLLGRLLGALGSNVTLSAVDYDGLANTNVQLLDLLKAKVGAGSIGSALGSTVSLGSFYLAVANALGPGNTAQVALLQSIAASVGTKQVNLGQILGMTTGGTSGLQSSLNVFDLVTAAAEVANGTNALSVPDLGLSLPPLANLSANLTAIEAPKVACGRVGDPAATATSTQVTLNVSTTAADVSVPGLLKTNVALSGTVKVAQATGTLTYVGCNPAEIKVAVADGLLGIDLTLNVTVSLNVLGIVIPVVGGPIHITGTSHSAGTADVKIRQDSDYDKPATVGYDNPGLPALTTDTSGLHLIGAPVGVLLAPIVNSLVSGLVNPLIGNLSGSLVQPLLHSLGADLSGADVYLRRVPECSVPRLVQ